jgi:cytochrome P450
MVEVGSIDVPLNTAQPHGALAEARRRCPVATSPPLGPDPRPRFNVVLWEDVEAVLRDPETYSSRVYEGTLTLFTGPTMVGMDGDQHRRVRGVVAKAFQKSALDRWERELVRPIFARLVDAIAANGRAELVDEVINKFPIQVICGMYGVPLEDVDQFREWSDGIIGGSHDPQRGYACKAAMRNYLRPIVEDRRADPREDDLLSELVGAVARGELSEEEMWGTLVLLVVGGTDTTYNAIGSVVAGILRRPDIADALRADPSLVPKVVEEGLRWEGPSARAERLVTRDVEIRGVPIPAGSALNVWLTSANYDEERFATPEQLDLARDPAGHLTFGIGPHVCLGINLARAELRVAVELLFGRLANLRLDPDRPGPEIAGTLMRGPDALHVRFDPSA